MFICGFVDGIEAYEEENAIVSITDDNKLRKRNCYCSPTGISLPSDATNVISAYGNLYFISGNNELHEYVLGRKETSKIHTNYLKESGRELTSLFVEPVNEQILLLINKTEHNVTQQEILKWKPSLEVADEEDYFSLFMLDEDEKVVEISGTDDFGITYTSKKRIWLIEQWRSRMTMWKLKLLPWKTPIIQVSCGKEHVIALTNDGSVLTMGKSTRGQLGLGSTSSHDTFQEVCILEPLKFTKVVAGGWHSLVLSETGDIYGWGWNESGQIGACLDNPDANNKQITKENIPKLLFLPMLLDTQIDVTFSDIFAGARHSVALTTDGCVYTWGWNGYGQLGHNTQEDKLQASLVNFFERKNLKVRNVKCGLWNSIFIVNVR